MKIYVVKYALTEGIEECEGVATEYANGTAVTAYMRDAGQCGMLLFKTQYAITLDDARAKAYAMRDKKIASLKKQIAKLEKMEF